MAEFRAAAGRAPVSHLAVAGLGIVAGVLMIAAEFSTVASVDVASGSCEVIHDSSPEIADRCELSGLERHGGALILLGLLTIVMAWGAGIGGSRPAGVALVFVGLVVLALGLLIDLPETNETGAIGKNFEGARGTASSGFGLELVAGGLALLAGALRLAQKGD